MTQQRQGGCHCGAVRFTLDMPENPVIRRCNCTICAMKGVVMLDAPMTSLTITAGEDSLSLYTFGSGQARHRFCSRCGIHTFHQLRSEPDHYGINVACIDGMSIYDFEETPVFDGQNHPADTGQYQYIGVMKFERTPG
ncbi:GFA family protein [Aurantiacibacter marinus]|uniref:Aldehyde-activating protein n=1 Tax=Aurantiacibacter marinus TaxID=874156 RepID=A0A0H0XS44_9SPHN|nr:GFA family protein [Aurantiacibacter marinus]KLI63120.1 aldehyde-activating protein [Aurantiacibacter marinus]